MYIRPGCHIRKSFAVTHLVDGHGAHQDTAGDEQLPVGVEPDEGEADLQKGDQEHAQEGTEKVVSNCNH